MTDSQQLLAEYVKNGSESAFHELVNRYLDLVYSTALRLVSGDAHRAQDVAQTVFVDLARKARALAGGVMLGGWLHRHACFVAANTMRGERRRQSREREAVEMNALHHHSEAGLALVAPILDEAINQLGEDDRAAILLRFFEQRDFHAVGEALGSNEDAARMRVNRALEKLESLLKHRGVTSSAAAQSGVLSTGAVQAAPAGLAVTISAAAALAGATLSATTATVTTMKLISVKSIAAILAAAVATGAGTYLVQQHEANRLRDENQNLLLAQKGLTGERDAALAVADGKAGELERLQKDQGDLLRLRAEVGRLRLQTNELVKLREDNRQLQAALAKAGQPAQATNPDENTPERQLAIAKMTDAKRLVLGLRMYADDNHNQFPDNFSQLAGYIDANQPPDTNRFEIVAPLSLTNITNLNDAVVLREKEASFMNGKWVKTYGFADGHSALKTQPPEGFDAWEQQHIIPKIPTGQ